MKNLLSILSLFFSVGSYACNCSNFMNFCQYSESDKEETVFMIKMPDSPNTEQSASSQYYDVEIIDQLFGPELNFDSLTLVYHNSTCHYFLEYFPDTMILKKSIFEDDSLTNFPTYEFINCQNNYLTFENGLISRNITLIDGNSDQFVDSIKYEDFLDWYPECASLVNTNEVSDFGEVLVYPNPTTQFLNVNNKSLDNVEFKLYNSVGELVSRGTLNLSSSTELTMVDHPNGIYYIRLEDGIRQESRKILKF